MITGIRIIVDRDEGPTELGWRNGEISNEELFGEAIVYLQEHLGIDLHGYEDQMEIEDPGDEPFVHINIETDELDARREVG